MKIALMGSNRAAIHCLDLLLERGHEVLVVVPSGGRTHPWHDSLLDFALKRGVRSVLDPRDVNHPLFVEHVRSFAPELILSVYYDQIFKKELLGLPARGCVNIHPSLLPKYRGVAPLIWAIMQGETRTGVTFHLIEPGIDTGPILLQREVAIDAQDTGYSLHLKVADVIRDMARGFLDGLERGTPWAPRAQSGEPSYFPRSAPAKNLIDWSEPAQRVYDCVRALTAPLPGCHGRLHGEKVFLWKVAWSRRAPSDGGSSESPGALSLKAGKPWVRAGDGWVEILEAGVAGIRVSGEDLVRMLKLAPGDRFGSDAPEGRSGLSRYIPFGLPSIGEEEVSEVAATLRSGWIGMGHKTELFEEEFARYVGAPHAVALSSCSAALHLSLAASGIGPGDEVITTPFTFVATAHAILHAGARPVFADIDPDTLNIDPRQIEARITPRTKAILPVHFGGLPCDMEAIQAIARRHGLIVVEDAAHAAGARYLGKMIGGLGAPACFSFYPNKNMTSIEGGMVTTSDGALAQRLRVLRMNGLTQDAWKRYLTKDLVLAHAVSLGYKCNMTDVQASVGVHQLRKLEGFLSVRERYAARLDEALAGVPGARAIARPSPGSRTRHALHLYVVLLEPGGFRRSRDEVVTALREKGIGAAIHYIPLHLHPFYQKELGHRPGDFPRSEEAGRSVLTLPCGPAIAPEDMERMAGTIREVLSSLQTARA